MKQNTTPDTAQPSPREGALRLAGYASSLLAAYWVPMMWLAGHPISEHLAQALLLVLVALMQPFSNRSLGGRSRLAWFPVMVLVCLVAFYLHARLAFEILDYEGLRFEFVWGMPVAAYLVFGSFWLHRFFMKRSMFDFA